MDLLESTLKVLQNRTVAKETLTLSKQDLDQYEQWIDQLKENLQEIQSTSSKNTKILEINNFTKTAFNEHSKESKMLFGLIYGYVQQIEESLNTISQREKSLDELRNENDERLHRLEIDFANSLKLLEIKKKDLDYELSKEGTDLQQKINAMVIEESECEEMWKRLVDELEEKEITLNALKSECDILQNNIDLETQQQESLIQIMKEENEKMIAEVSSDIELNNKIREVEDSILTISQKVNDVLECKADVLVKLIEAKTHLGNLEKQCLGLEEDIINTENEEKQKLEKLEQDNELKKKNITEQESKLQACQNRTIELDNEKEQINIKLVAISEEIQGLRRFGDEKDEFFKNNNLEKLIEEHKNLIKNSEELLRMISDTKMEFESKEKQLNELNISPNPECVEMSEKLAAFELESNQKKTELGKELEEIEMNNKKLQQSVEQDQAAIKELSVQKVKIEQERDGNQKMVKNLMMQCDKVEKEIRRLEVLNLEKAKLFPKPSQKRAASPAKKPVKKRGIRDTGSDSSVDGERMSYAEFMAKKKMMEGKKQKRYATKNN